MRTGRTFSCVGKGQQGGGGSSGISGGKSMEDMSSSFTKLHPHALLSSISSMKLSHPKLKYYVNSPLLSCWTRCNYTNESSSGFKDDDDVQFGKETSDDDFQSNVT